MLAAALFGAGTVSALPAHAVNVGTEAELRSAISSGQTTITFTANITLTADLPHVANNVTIDGGNFTLSGNNSHRGLAVESGTVAINNLTIANAKAQGGNGGLGGRGGSGGGGGVTSGRAVTITNSGGFSGQMTWTAASSWSTTARRSRFRARWAAPISPRSPTACSCSPATTATPAPRRCSEAP